MNFLFDFFKSVCFKFPLLCFKYVGRNQNCLFSGSMRIGTTQLSYVTDSSYGSQSGNENWLEQQVASVGPIAVEIYASANFIKYKSGK